MQCGLGLLKWPPAAFWDATAHELASALEGAAGELDGASGDGMTRAKYEAMKRKLGVN